MNGYRENELVINRTAVLLWGATDADRKAWAEEAATALGHALSVVENPAQLETALASPDAVVYLPDIAALGHGVQTALVRCLKERELRPKIVAGLAGSRQLALDRGLLRMDLDYSLAVGRLDLSADGVKDAIRSRRAKKQPKHKDQKGKVPARSAGGKKAGARSAARR